MLILIGAGFAVASFILLTMRTETGFKYRSNTANQSVKTEKQEKQNKKKEKKESGGQGIRTILQKGKDKKPKDDITVSDAQPSAPLRPEMVAPEQPEDEAVSLNVIDGLDFTGMGEIGMADDAVPADSEETGETAPFSDEGGVNDIESNIISPALEEADTSAPAFDPFALDELPQPEEESTKLEDDTEEVSASEGGDDIFAIFDEVDDEEVSETSQFAQELDDVTMDDMLSETANLSQELRNIFNQFRRT